MENTMGSLITVSTASAPSSWDMKPLLGSPAAQPPMPHLLIRKHGFGGCEELIWAGFG